MGNIQFWDSKILFVDSKIAMDPACCCGTGVECGGCAVPDTVTAALPGGWSVGPRWPCCDCPEVSAAQYQLDMDPLSNTCYWSYLDRVEDDPCCADQPSELGVSATLYDSLGLVTKTGSHPFPWYVMLRISYWRYGGYTQANFKKTGIESCDDLAGVLSLALDSEVEYADKPCTAGIGTPASLTF